MIRHLACVVDGNRRWAQRRGLPASLGHKEGIVGIERTVEFCLKHHIAYLSLYVFSLENFVKRSQEEQRYLFDLLIAYFKEQGLRVFREKGIRVCFIGDRARFPGGVAEVCREVEEKTAHGTALTVYLLFCYGGRQEIVTMARRIADEVQRGVLTLDAITEQVVADRLWHSGVPDPELIIRTGGAKRLSNFLPYQSVYSELYFTDTLWPDITDTLLQDALNYLLQCRRNFGA